MIKRHSDDDSLAPAEQEPLKDRSLHSKLTCEGLQPSN